MTIKEKTMATLKANGTEVGRWVRYSAISSGQVKSEYALFENRWILRKNSYPTFKDGWKRWARVREGADLLDYLNKKMQEPLVIG